MIELQTFILWSIPILFAITLHEAAHGFVAEKLGDGSARMMGRITLNPIKHIDPIGTIALPIILYFTTGFVFGWAKPVPVNFNSLTPHKLGVILVAIAGPGANLLMVFLWLLVFKIADANHIQYLVTMANIGMQINIILMVFNLLPLPPLDGSRVLSVMLPNKISYLYNQLEQYGLYILIALLFLGIFDYLILPINKTIYAFLIS